MPFHIENQTLGTVFPFHIVFDKEFKILQYGESLKKLLPELTNEQDFNQLFQIFRPRTIQGKAENIIKNQQAIFIIKIVPNSIELKGQIIYSEKYNSFLFICLPIIKEQSLLNAWSLTINDFAIYDQTTDFLFLLQSNQKTMEDLRKLSNEIQESFEKTQASEEELRQNTEELKTINEDLAYARELLIFQKKELENKNQYILSSINYARRIQESILPTSAFIESLFPNSFVLFMPKDILSGDFYWAASKKSKSIIAAIDCTGHGVPGAFMSLIVENLLDRIVNEQNITEPDLILENMHAGLQRLLKQEETLNNETADLAICVVDKKNKILEFAGAKLSAFLVKNNELTEIKGDKYSIGGRYKEDIDRNFTKHFITLDSEMTVYLSTDGYKDQFGGEKDKKFSSNAFRNLIMNAQSKSMDTQKEHFEQTINDWKQEKPQTDDMLVMGIRL